MIIRMVGWLECCFIGLVDGFVGFGDGQCCMGGFVVFLDEMVVEDGCVMIGFLIVMWCQ